MSRNSTGFGGVSRAPGTSRRVVCLAVVTNLSPLRFQQPVSLDVTTSRFLPSVTYMPSDLMVMVSVEASAATTGFSRHCPIMEYFLFSATDGCLHENAPAIAMIKMTTLQIFILEAYHRPGWQGMERFFLHTSNVDEARPMPCATDTVVKSQAFV